MVLINSRASLGTAESEVLLAGSRNLHLNKLPKEFLFILGFENLCYISVFWL